MACGQPALAAVTLLLAVLSGRFWDMGQCERACRVENGRGAPDVHGRTGSWLDPTITGRRLFSSPGECECSFAPFARPQSILRSPRVMRIHRAVNAKDQWWFSTAEVCGGDGVSYPNAAAAHATGAFVVNCGQCGATHLGEGEFACSTLVDTAAMHTRSRNLTKIDSVGAVLWLVAGDWAHRMLFRSSLVGYSDQCAKCWLEETKCNLASCAKHCLFGWQSLLSTRLTKNVSTEFNECTHCDELYCSAYYLQACGANRRTAGVVSDISRPGEHVCGSARADALKRVVPHPDLLEGQQTQEL